MQPLLLLKQTLESSFDAGPLDLNGPYVSFTTARQFLSMTNAQPEREFQIGLTLSTGKSLTVRFGYSSAKAFSLLDTRYSNVNGRPILLREDMTAIDIAKLHVFKNQPSKGLTVNRDRCFLSLYDADREFPHPATIASIQASQALLRAIYVPALRGSRERAFRAASEGPRYPGYFQNYIAALIHLWQNARSSKLNDLKEGLASLGLTRQIEAVRISDVQFEIRVGRALRKESSDLVNLADVGFGVSQVLPVVVALLAAERGQLVYMEEPEADLHPQAQVALAKLMARAVLRGIVLVVETHSTFLLTGIQTLIATGDLEASLVKLHWFERSRAGFTKVTSGNFDKRGRFGKWPMDFDDVILDSESAYLDAVSASYK